MSVCRGETVGGGEKRSIDRKAGGGGGGGGGGGDACQKAGSGLGGGRRMSMDRGTQASRSGEEDEEDGVFKANAWNEEDCERDRAMLVRMEWQEDVEEIYL